MSVKRVAAIDCGTNSVRLLIAEADEASGLLNDVVREMRIVRLGEGVDATGRLGAAALHRAFGAVDEYAAMIERSNVDAVRFVATSATRDAENRDEFVSGIRGRLGVEPEVISGAEEAQLSFTGATGTLEIAGAATPCLVVDIGGGSTEFVMGEPGRAPTASASIDIGCVRMTERHFVTDPPWPAEVAAARDDIDAAIAEVAKSVPLRQAGSLVGLAGSVTTVAALALGMWEYDSTKIHGAVITAADIHRVCEELLYANRDKRSANPVVHPGRVDVIAAGSLVLSAIVAHTGLPEILVSEHDILDGIAASLTTAT